jgi:hypothetical protein
MEILILLLLLVAPIQAEMFPMHRFHVQKLGRLECNLCHQAVSKGSVELKRPGHDQCKLCHMQEFQPASKNTICTVCHRTAGNSGLLAFPPLPDRVLANFAHPKHVDPKARVDGKTGFRADCTFCHRFSPGGLEPVRPGHVICAACHSKADMPAQLTPFLRAAGCRGCHDPESTEGPAPTRRARPVLARFSHAVHMQTQRESNLDCTSCHGEIAGIPAQSECSACHAAMRPVSHTARWRDDLHGKYAGIDRVQCATCHATDYCSRCHNELPASHAPLPLFKNGGHARSALLNERACFTCHTYQNTCQQCHARNLRP